MRRVKTERTRQSDERAVPQDVPPHFGSRRHPEQPAPTMADVARQAGVSAMTVSRALKNKVQVSSPARQKILRAVSELGYVLDQAAGSLSSRKTGFIATLIPSINNSNFSDTARGITDELGRTGLQLLLGYTDYSEDDEEKLIEAMLRRRPEGVILTGGVHTPHTRRMLSSAGIPVIETWDVPPEPIDQVVGFSNEEAMRLLITTLAAKGYRKFGYVGGTTTRELSWRTTSKRPYARARRTWLGSWAHCFLGRAPNLDRAWRPGYPDPPRAVARYGSCRFRVRFAGVLRPHGMQAA